MHHQLEALIEVVRRGTVTGAARSLYLTQPALTARLNALERDVGAKLLVRRRGGVRLTEAGRAFLPYAERALQAIEEGRLVIGELGRGATGHIAVCASPIVSTYALPAILNRFSQTHPAVQVSVRTGHSEEMVQLVKRDEASVALVRAFNDPAIEQLMIYEDELVLVVHADHPCGDVARLTELGGEHFVLFDRASSYHELTQALFIDAGITQQGFMELDNVDSAKKMVELGLGIAFLPHVAIADEVRSGRLRIVELEDRTPPRRPIVAVRRKDAGDPLGATAAFLALLDEMRPELQAAASATAA
jgi:DNA-binding transcriptional LysR family regulator